LMACERIALEKCKAVLSLKKVSIPSLRSSSCVNYFNSTKSIHSLNKHRNTITEVTVCHFLFKKLPLLGHCI